MKQEIKKSISFLAVVSVLSAIAYTLIFNYAKTGINLSKPAFC